MQENLLMRPLNLASSVYAERWDRSVPLHVNAYLSIFHVGVDYPLLEDPREESLLGQLVVAAGQCTSEMCVSPGQDPIRISNLVIHTLTSPEFSTLFPQPLPAEMRWVYKGLLLDMAFCTDPQPDEADKAVAAVAMRFLNRWHLMTGSMEPRDHLPMKLPGVTPAGYSAMIGDLFQTGPGLWTRSLATVRTRLLIFARAILQGRDPVEEWERFLAAGGSLHFDYPQLCG